MHRVPKIAMLRVKFMGRIYPCSEHSLLTIQKNYSRSFVKQDYASIQMELAAIYGHEVSKVQEIRMVLAHSQ